MNFLADECCPAPVVEALRASGHDVLYVLETAAGSVDLEVAASAIAGSRVLITEDYDFAELAIRQGLALPGIVILALGGQSIDVRRRRTVDVVARLGQALVGHVTIVEVNRERRRPLPR